MSPDCSRVSCRGEVTKGAALLLVALLGLPVAAVAQAPKKTPMGLAGSWSGGGSVQFASGGRERAQCRAHYRHAGRTSYTLHATCATPSGRATQVATVRQVGDNRYSGSFYNSEYSVSGVINVIVHGSRQTVRLDSDSGSAVISLSR